MDVLLRWISKEHEGKLHIVQHESRKIGFENVMNKRLITYIPSAK